jgi:hypothetical protein
MYERMLDKKTAPTDADFVAHCGTCAGLFTALDEFLTGEGRAQKTLRFPYGNHYGWGYKYSVKNKHLCDIFAEKDAFTVMVRLSDAQFSEIYESLLDCGKEYVDHRYPCGEGGWIHYRATREEHLNDLKKILRKKLG